LSDAEKIDFVTFWTHLENRLCKEFSNSEDALLKTFWCDGIYAHPTDHQFTRKHVNDHRKIIAKVWLGTTGQEAYLGTIHFGRKSLSRYARGLNILECIPEVDAEKEWILIDTENKVIEIFLD